MSTTTNLRTTATSRRRAVLTAGALAALVTAAGAVAAPANALVPLDGFRANVVLTSASFATADILNSLIAVHEPASRLAQIANELAEGNLAG